MAPAIEKVAAIDLTNFVITIVLSENAIRTTIQRLKSDFGRKRSGKGA
jgi:hypothetical protein